MRSEEIVDSVSGEDVSAEKDSAAEMMSLEEDSAEMMSLEEDSAAKMMSPQEDSGENTCVVKRSTAQINIIVIKKNEHFFNILNIALAEFLASAVLTRESHKELSHHLLVNILTSKCQ